MRVRAVVESDAVLRQYLKRKYDVVNNPGLNYASSVCQEQATKGEEGRLRTWAVSWSDLKILITLSMRSSLARRTKRNRQLRQAAIPPAPVELSSFLISTETCNAEGRASARMDGGTEEGQAHWEGRDEVESKPGSEVALSHPPCIPDEATVIVIA